jgi:hypothetical protein
MTRSIATLGLLLALTAPSLARADIGLDEQTVLLSISGHVAADRDAANQRGATAVSMSGTGSDKLIWVGVVKAESWNADSFEGWNLISLVKGYTPGIIVVGKPALVAKVQGAQVGSRIVIQGLFDRGARTLLLGMVEVTPGR